MSRRLFGLCALMAPVLAAANPLSAQSASAVDPPRVYRVTVVRDEGARSASAVLVRRTITATDTTLYFVTTADLFKGPRGQVLPWAAALRVDVLPGLSLPVRPADVATPMGPALNVAVFKVIAIGETPAPSPLTVDVPRPGEAFALAGFDQEGREVTSTQRVSRVSSLAVGGTAAMPLGGCAGTAAIARGRIFGIVSECEAGKVPVVMPFDAAAPWIARHVPDGMMLTPPQVTGFTLTRREVPAPPMTVSCSEPQTRDIEIPFVVKRGEVIVDAGASLLERSAIRLGEVSVVRVADRTLTLRFTVAGEPPPAFVSPVPCPPGQALVSVHLDVMTRRTK